MARFGLKDHFTWAIVAGAVLAANGLIQLGLGDAVLGIASLIVGTLAIVVGLVRPAFRIGPEAVGDPASLARGLMPLALLALLAALGLGLFAALPAYYRGGVEPWPVLLPLFWVVLAAGLALSFLAWRRQRSTALAAAGAALAVVAVLAAATPFADRAIVALWRAAHPPEVRLSFLAAAPDDKPPSEALLAETRAVLQDYLESIGQFHAPVPTDRGVVLLLADAASYDVEEARNLALAGYIGFHLVHPESDRLAAEMAPGRALPAGWRPVDDRGRIVFVQAAPVVTGAEVREAWMHDDSRGGTAVRLTFDNEGQRRFAEATAANVGRRLAVLHKGKVVMAPTIREAIRGGQVEITGSFDDFEAADLVRALYLGGLPAPLFLDREETLAR